MGRSMLRPYTCQLRWLAGSFCFFREGTTGSLQTDRCGGLAALAEVRVPEEAGGDGAEGAPRGAHFFEFFGGGAGAELLHFLDGGGEGEIAGGPDVGAAQGAQKINVGGPAADAFERDEFFAGVVVVKFVQGVKIELFLID